MNRINRRHFFLGAAATAALQNRLGAQSTADKVRTAFIGMGN